MADNVIARKSGNWQANSVLPDVSKTPMGGLMLPVPYPVTSPFGMSKGTLGTVTANKNQVWGFDPTKVPVTQGDEAGTGKGVASGTVAKDTWPQEKSSTVKAEKTEVIRNDDKVEMNGDKASTEEEEKAKRQKCREEQVAAGAQSKDPAVQAAAGRLSRNMKAMEHAKLSDHVYDPTKPVPAGWRNISNDPAAMQRYGLTENEMRINGTDFRAQVYEPNPAVFGGNGNYRPTVVFQGTNGARSGSDWSNNIRQSTNFHSPYYERAVGIANVSRATGARVDFAGHSLGGGLASAASQATGRFATTFNSAGLNSRTVPGYGRLRGNPRMVNAYHVRGDILTNAQEGSWWQSVLSPARGLQTWATPDAIGNKFTLPGHGSPLARHDMSQVMAGIEGEKTQDQATIAQDTGKEC